MREAFAEFEHTGSLFPTSRWAAEALASPVADHTTPKKILELGPGQGSVTVQIIEQMIDGDELVVCEINPRLMLILKNRLRKSALFVKRKSQIKFFTGPAQELPEDTNFDIIVCGLPFLNFDLFTVEEIFRKIERVSSSKAVMTYFEFIGIRSFSTVFSPPDRKKRIKQLSSFFESLRRVHPVKRHHVWLNMLPIHVHTIQRHNGMPFTSLESTSSFTQ